MSVTTCQLTGGQPGYDRPDEEAAIFNPSLDLDSREWAMGGLEMPVNLTWFMGACRVVVTVGWLLDYAAENGMVNKRKARRVEDLEAIADQWVEQLVIMSTAHGPEPRTDADEASDDLLRPLLSAPIAQIRQFIPIVARKLEADPRVPFLVWSGFKKLVEPAVLKGPDGAAVELQHVLAMEVAELVVPRLSAEEYVNAMAGALQWRTPATLAQVKQVLVEKPEAKPVLRGRQSCLFLHLLDGEGEELASVVL